MGELSKSVGEAGEKLIRSFFDRIGWTPIQTGVTLECHFPDKHKRKEAKSGRRDHGVDLVFSYLCPIAPGVRRNILISVKNSSYERTTNKTSLVREDFKDLNTALECFGLSDLRVDLQAEGGAQRSEDVGILIRINRDPNVDRSVLGADIENLTRVGTSNNLYFVENDRFDFVDSCLNYLDWNHSSCINHFNVQRTAISVGGEVRRTESALLPLHSLVGGPIVVRSKGGKKSLIIFSDEDFSEDCLKRLIGMALQVSEGWPNEIKLVVPNFDSTKSESLQKVLSQVKDKEFANTIVCDSFEIKSRLK